VNQEPQEPYLLLPLLLLLMLLQQRHVGHRSSNRGRG
jgi:hypothetical protein